MKFLKALLSRICLKSSLTKTRGSHRKEGGIHTDKTGDNLGGTTTATINRALDQWVVYLRPTKTFIVPTCSQKAKTNNNETFSPHAHMFRERIVCCHNKWWFCTSNKSGFDGFHDSQHRCVIHLVQEKQWVKVICFSKTVTFLSNVQCLETFIWNPKLPQRYWKVIR